MRDAARAGGQRRNASCTLCCCIGSHAAYRCLRADHCDLCDRQRCRTSTACSNTLSEVEFVRCSFAMLVSYMPLAVYFRAQNKSPTAHASATVNDASRINASRTRRTASAATSCTASGGRSGTSRIERARATSHPPRPEDKRRGPAAHEYRNCTREAARSRRIATNSTVRRADYGWTSLDGARVESGR